MAQTVWARFIQTTSIKIHWCNKSVGALQLFPNWPSRHISSKIDTKTLGNLRKQTGYSLSLCREALLANDNDMKAANTWLCDQARKRGLQKAEKLQGRKAGEGLIGVLVEGNNAAMVEVCCETDFVSQNDFFQRLVAKATVTALQHRKMIVQRGLDLGGTFTQFREILLTHKLKEMKIPSSSETVNDAVLQVVGRLGERVALRRAVTMTTDDTSVIASYAHGPFTFNVEGCKMGKYAALVGLQPNGASSSTSDLSSLATKLAQHIVGMNPAVISLEDAPGHSDVDKSDVLLEQQYLMDDKITVKELLLKNSVSFVDFLRLECGSE